VLSPDSGFETELDIKLRYSFAGLQNLGDQQNASEIGFERPFYPES
jgi:hypothetical protein